MKPERNATTLLSITRSKAKMYEFQIPAADHIALPQNPNLLFALAVGMLGDAAAAIASGDADDPVRLTATDSLRFSATFFDAHIEAQLDIGLAPEFGVLASAAYYLSESPGNSRVVLKAFGAPDAPDQGSIYSLVYLLLTGIETAIESEQYGDRPSNVLTTLGRFYRLEADGEAVIEAATELRKAAYESGSDRDVLYSDIALSLCRLKLSNASRTLLPETSSLALNDWRPALSKAIFPIELWPAQQRICNAGLLEGKSAIIQMPTSAGKTRATELIIRSAFLAGRTDLAVIVAPFRALCHDIRSDLAKAFQGDGIILDEASDAFELDFIFDSLVLPKTVLIVTPEKLLYILRRQPELAEQIGLVIYDEGHLFDSASRGVTYELLLTSLKLTVGPNTQIVLISAVIENAAAVAGWLVGNPEAVVDGKGMMPTAKNIAFASWATARGQLRYVSPTDPDDEDFFVPRVIEGISFPRVGRTPPRDFPASNGPEVGLYLGLKLVSNGQVAVFCGRKDSATKLCGLAVELFDRGLAFPSPREFSNAAELDALSALISFHLGAKASYSKAATFGVFAHHGNVPQGIRLAIEHAMKAGLAKFVVCTSTLAQGVNLPIRYLIVTSVQQGQDRILVRDFHNLIGRAGRAGMHTEGSIIFADPAIYDQKNVFRQSWRWQAAKVLLDSTNSEPCVSNILLAFEPFAYGEADASLRITMDGLKRLLFDETAVIAEVIAGLLNQQSDETKRDFSSFARSKARIIQGIGSYLLAHLDFDAPEFDAHLTVLVENTLAYHIADEGQKAELRILFEGITEALRENAGDNASRAALRRSPLPPDRALLVNKWLADHQQELSQAIEDGELFEFVFQFVSNHLMPSVFAGLSDSSVALVVGQMWFDERTYEEIFNELSRLDVRKGRNRHRPTIDDVVSYCESAFGYEVAMIVATMADAFEDVDEEIANALSLLQRQLKYGLDSLAAIAFFEAGFADRKIASDLGKAFPNVTDRAQARLAVRQSQAQIAATLAPYPSYFRAVFSEIVGG